MAPGDKLGKYELIRQIAVGGMAELYLARTLGIEGFEKLVVVKRILPQYITNASFVTMFLNEARLAATLQHPNIAQVYDIGLEEGDYFFAMEYVHGEDLDRVSSTSTEQGVPMSLDAALTLVAGLCAGLHYAHEKIGPDGKPLEVVHRDVSPSNVLVSYDGAVKLVDFGIARAAARATTTHGGLKGKIAYMSPEQCRAASNLDRRSDIFSIGTILYELTVGQLPFSGVSEYAILNQIVNDDVPPPSRFVPGYPPALEKIVMRALARDPEHRFETSVQMQQQLEDFAHDNRLRVSPLVLARLMSSLFPARLEEWDQAKTQGAFFVEQHVLQTLIESGKTSDTGRAYQTSPPPFSMEEATEADTTLASPPPIMGDMTRPFAPIIPSRVPATPGRVPLGTPPRIGVAPPPEPPPPHVVNPPSPFPRAMTPAAPVPRAATPRRAGAPPAPGAAEPPPQRASRPAITRASTPALSTPRAATPAVADPPERAPTPAPVPRRPSTPEMTPEPLPPMPTPAPGSLRTPIPGEVPILSTPTRGTLVSSNAPPDAVVQHRAPSHVDVTERVRIPGRVHQETIQLRIPRRIPVIPLATIGTLAIAVAVFIAMRGGSPHITEPSVAPDAAPVQTQTMPASAPPPEEPQPAVAPSADAEPEHVEAPIADTPVQPVDKATVTPAADKSRTLPHPPKPPKVVKPRPKSPVEPARPKATRSDAKPPSDPKESNWNADSPFLPVRNDKH